MAARAKWRAGPSRLRASFWRGVSRRPKPRPTRRWRSENRQSISQSKSGMGVAERRRPWNSSPRVMTNFARICFWYLLLRKTTNSLNRCWTAGRWLRVSSRDLTISAMRAIQGRLGIDMGSLSGRSIFLEKVYVNRLRLFLQETIFNDCFLYKQSMEIVCEPTGIADAAGG